MKPQPLSLREFLVHGLAVLGALAGLGLLLEDLGFADRLAGARLELYRPLAVAFLLAALAAQFLGHRRRRQVLARQCREVEDLRQRHKAEEALRSRAEYLRRLHEVDGNRERRRMAELAHAREERFRALIEKSAEGVALLAADGLLLYGGPSTRQLLGFTEDELPGRNFLDLVHPVDRETVRGLLLRSVEQPGVDFALTFRCLGKDGTDRHLEANGVNRLPDPHVQGIVLNYRDVTARKLAEESRAETDRWARLVTEAADDVTLVIDEHSTIRFVNPAVERIFGYSAAELAGQPVTLLMPESYRPVHRAGLQRYCRTGDRHLPWRAVQMPGLRKNGTEVLVELSFGEGRRAGERLFVAVAREVSETRRVEPARPAVEVHEPAELDNVYLPVDYVKSLPERGDPAGSLSSAAAMNP
jgi:PAS domain S-box-containing protein